ncbi:MAG TPA: TIGR00269 family protein [Candidatus Bilamarchaeum sp.]|nr:TIGR00269 family protein [Candidatus Bilamarchaeum sp.]
MSDSCHCGAEPSVFLHYSQKHMCSEHFMMMFDKRVRKTVREFKMLKKGDRVAVGLSGGKDSIVVLHSLASIAKSLPMELVAITIDEGIKGYRERTLRIAKAECEKLGVEHVVFSYEKSAGKTMDSIVAANPDEIPCANCGVLRRYLLNRGAREVRADKLATGHNLDDLAQTVMMNIMRAEPSRLARFSDPIIKSERFIPRIRPLLRTPEKEVAIYALLRGIELESVECPYARFAFRGHVRKMLNEAEEKYPGTKFKIVNSFLDMEGALRAKYADEASLPPCDSCGEPSSQKTCMFCQKVRLINK